MNALAAFALIATAAPQGSVGPIAPTGPITFPRFIAVNQLANPGVESGALAPWQTGGTVMYWDRSLDGTSATLVGQSLQGYATNGNTNSGNRSFRMNAEYPGYVLQGSGHSAATYVQQSLSTPIHGSAIFVASVWATANSLTGFTVEIDYTSGASSIGTLPPGAPGWRKWDFRNVIDPTRTVKAIRFRATAYWNGPESNAPALIDDVNLSILVRI